MICCRSGARKRIATAARTSATPSQPMSPRIRFSMSAPPPLAVHRLRGEEQAESHETQVIDDVPGVDDALGEVVEVLGDRQVRQHGLYARAESVADPRDDPEPQGHAARPEPRT